MLKVSPLARSFVLAAGVLTSGCASVVHNVDLSTCRETKHHDLNLLLFRITVGEADLFNPSCSEAHAAAKMVLGRMEDGKLNPVGIMFGKKFYEKANPDVQQYLDRYLAQEGFSGADLEKMLREKDSRIAFRETPPAANANGGFVCRTLPSGLSVCGPAAAAR